MQVITLPAKGHYFIFAGTLITGDGTPARHDMLLHIDSGMIKNIHSLPPPDTKAESGTNENHRKKNSFLDCSNLTIMPGLIDCHVHLALDGIDSEKAMQNWKDPNEIQRQMITRLKNTLANGILTVRDGGDSAGINLLFSKKVQKGEITGPRIIATGNALRKKNMYGSFLGENTGANPAEAVSRLAAAGARQIKVLVSGIVSFKEYGRVGPIHFSQEELKTIVEEAHSLGLTVMAHANSDQAVTMAASAGVDSLEHGYFISRDSLKMLAELNIPWVPTLIPVAAWSLKPGVRNINPEHRKIAERTYRQHQAMIAEASAMGITLGVGTDSGALGVQHGDGYLKELELYREAGLSTAEILQAATANGARIVGLEQGAGLVLPGSPANLIAVAGNFLKDLKIGVRLAILR
ncbi:MAG TPA: hypothetical protein DCM26_00180 [Desulfotomaculum sp.]|nr:hypothetical protein [Desulfotomaculum sp.]